MWRRKSVPAWLGEELAYTSMIILLAVTFLSRKTFTGTPLFKEIDMFSAPRAIESMGCAF